MAKKRKSAGKVAATMREWKAGTLHSGSKSGPKVKSRKQAVAIGLSQARKAGEDVSPAPRKPRKKRSTYRTRMDKADL